MLGSAQPASQLDLARLAHEPTIQSAYQEQPNETSSDNCTYTEAINNQATQLENQ